jgi:hypothetical protein
MLLNFFNKVFCYALIYRANLWANLWISLWISLCVGCRGESCRLTRACLASIAGSARKHAGRTATVSDTVMHDVMEVLMKKIVSAALLAVALFGVTACSSYPGWVPDWAQIGAEEKS